MEWKIRLAAEVERAIPLDPQWVGVFAALVLIAGGMMACVESFYNGLTGLAWALWLTCLTGGFFAYVLLV